MMGRLGIDLESKLPIIDSTIWNVNLEINLKKKKHSEPPRKASRSY